MAHLVPAGPTGTYTAEFGHEQPFRLGPCPLRSARRRQRSRACTWCARGLTQFNDHGHLHARTDGPVCGDGRVSTVSGDSGPDMWVSDCGRRSLCLCLGVDAINTCFGPGSGSCGGKLLVVGVAAVGATGSYFGPEMTNSVGGGAFRAARLAQRTRQFVATSQAGFESGIISIAATEIAG